MINYQHLLQVFRQTDLCPPVECVLRFVHLPKNLRYIYHKRYCKPIYQPTWFSGGPHFGWMFLKMVDSASLPQMKAIWKWGMMFSNGLCRCRHFWKAPGLGNAWHTSGIARKQQPVITLPTNTGNWFQSRKYWYLDLPRTVPFQLVCFTPK